MTHFSFFPRLHGNPEILTASTEKYLKENLDLIKKALSALLCRLANMWIWIFTLAKKNNFSLTLPSRYGRKCAEGAVTFSARLIGDCRAFGWHAASPHVPIFSVFLALFAASTRAQEKNIHMYTWNTHKYTHVFMHLLHPHIHVVPFHCAFLFYRTR